jgi:DNA invertase Pin-like site-specific DNA recombinase
MGMTRPNGQKRARSGAPVRPVTRPTATTRQSDDAAIYCRRSSKGDKEQITVTRQKKLALQDCEHLGLSVAPQHVYIDNGASAWQRNRKRPGWDALLEAARRGEVKHIVCYHPDRLMRQPHDLEELLSISDQHGIMLYGRINRRDLQDPDDRYALRIEVAHACRSSDDASRRLKDERAERAERGLPKPGGYRRYGYDKTGMRVNAREAAIIQEVFRRYVAGEGPVAIATDLNRRGVRTAKGQTWIGNGVRELLSREYLAGIRAHNGEVVGTGVWPAIIDRATWDLAQEMKQFRSAEYQPPQGASRPRRFYLLRGVVTCGRCGTAMTGVKGMYKCTRDTRTDHLRCGRRIMAEQLEKFVEDAAVRFLEKLAVGAGRPSRLSQEAKRAQEQIEDDERQLHELNQMWTHKEVTTREYRVMRAAIMERIKASEPKVVVTRPIEALKGLIGSDAAQNWESLTPERKNATIRFLFAAVIIGPRVGKTGVFNYDRIEIEENELG